MTKGAAFVLQWSPRAKLIYKKGPGRPNLLGLPDISPTEKKLQIRIVAAPNNTRQLFGKRNIVPYLALPEKKTIK